MRIRVEMIVLFVSLPKEEQHPSDFIHLQLFAASPTVSLYRVFDCEYASENWAGEKQCTENSERDKTQGRRR